MDGTQVLLALGGCLWGAALSFVKYLLTRHLEDRPPGGFLMASLIRHGVNLFALAAAGLLCWGLGLPMMAALAGTAVGVTIPTIGIALCHRLRQGQGSSEEVTEP